MKLLDRLSSGLFNPKRLKLFANDKGGIVVLFFTILVIIALLPSIFIITKTDVLSYDAELEIRSILTGINMQYEIKDGELNYIGTEEEHEYIYIVGGRFDICLTTQESVDTYNIYISNMNKLNNSQLVNRVSNRLCFVLYKDHISLQTFGIDYELGKYKDYEEFEGIDFSNSNINNFDLWDPLFMGCKKMLSSYVPYVKIGSIIGALISEIISLLIWTLFVCVISRLTNREYTFKNQWKIIIYCSIAYVIGDCLSVLLNFGALYYIGLAITVFYAFGFDKFGGSKNEL